MRAAGFAVIRAGVVGVAMLIGLLSLAACGGTGGGSGEDGRPSEQSLPTAVPTSPSGPDSTLQSESAPAAELRAIDQRYADITNRRKSFRQVDRDLDDFSTEGGKLSAFLDGDRLVLIDATFYGETGQSHREFYYDESGRLFLVLETESRYEGPFGPLASTRERRYYFQGGSPIRLVDDGREISANDPDYLGRFNAVVQLSEQLSQETRRP